MEFIIPKSFKIFNDKYTVKEYKKIDPEHSMGEHDYMKKSIKLKRDMSIEEKERTFFHEIMHCVLDQLGYDKLSADEKFVDQIGSALHQIIKTAK